MYIHKEFKSTNDFEISYITKTLKSKDTNIQYFIHYFEI